MALPESSTVSHDRVTSVVRRPIAQRAVASSTGRALLGWAIWATSLIEKAPSFSRRGPFDDNGFAFPFYSELKALSVLEWRYHSRSGNSTLTESGNGEGSLNHFEDWVVGLLGSHFSIESLEVEVDHPEAHFVASLEGDDVLKTLKWGTLAKVKLSGYLSVEKE